MIGTLSDIKSRFMEVKQQIRFIFVAIVVFPGNGGIGWIGDLAPMSNLRNEESYALEKDTMKSNPHCFLGVQGKGNLREVVRESLSSLYWDSCRVWEGDVMGFSLLYIKIRR